MAPQRFAHAPSSTLNLSISSVHTAACFYNKSRPGCLIFFSTGLQPVSTTPVGFIVLICLISPLLPSFLLNFYFQISLLLSSFLSFFFFTCFLPQHSEVWLQKWWIKTVNFTFILRLRSLQISCYFSSWNASEPRTCSSDTPVPHSYNFTFKVYRILKFTWLLRNTIFRRAGCIVKLSESPAWAEPLCRRSKD